MKRQESFRMGLIAFVPGYGEVRGAPMTRCGHQTRPEIDAGVIRS